MWTYLGSLTEAAAVATARLLICWGMWFRVTQLDTCPFLLFPVCLRLILVVWADAAMLVVLDAAEFLFLVIGLFVSPGTRSHVGYCCRCCCSWWYLNGLIDWSENLYTFQLCLFSSQFVQFYTTTRPKALRVSCCLPPSAGSVPQKVTEDPTEGGFCAMFRSETRLLCSLDPTEETPEGQCVTLWILSAWQRTPSLNF